MSTLILTKTDAQKLREKDCQDFRSLDDGTLVGDPKYCKRSFTCRESGMKSDYALYSGPADGIVNGAIVTLIYTDHYDYLCTGMYVKRDEKGLDEQAS